MLDGLLEHLNPKIIEATLVSWTPLLATWLGKILLACVLLWAGWWMTNRLSTQLEKILSLRHWDIELQKFILSLCNLGLKILLVITVASTVGIPTTSFVAVLSAAGLAIGLALKGGLSNFAGGVIIIVFRPFQLGEEIEGANVRGTVENIHLFNTLLCTADNKRVVVPNAILANSTIINYDRLSKRRMFFEVSVDCDVSFEVAREKLLSLAQDNRVHKEPPPDVVVSELGDEQNTLRLRVWVSSKDYGALLLSFNEAFMRMMVEIKKNKNPKPDT